MSEAEKPAQNVVPLRPPREREEQGEYLAMVAFLVAWGVLFLGLFMAWAIARSSASVWPPAGTPHLPRGLGALDACVLSAATFAVHLAVRAVRQGLRARAVQALVVAVSLGGMFLALEAALWTDLAARGLTLESGAYAELFFVLNGFHALQFVAGELALFWALSRTWRGLINAARAQPLRLWALYWYACAGVGWLAYVLLYLA